MRLQEAFRALDQLTEDTFSLDTDGINKLSSYLHDDDSVDVVNVIDPDASTEEDLQDSYVGKVILDCSVCHSKLYKDKEEVELDEEGTVANVGEECPYCYTSSGFKIIGEVADFSGSDEEVETDDTYEDDNTVEEGLFGRKKSKGKEVAISSLKPNKSTFTLNGYKYIYQGDHESKETGRWVSKASPVGKKVDPSVQVTRGGFVEFPTAKRVVVEALLVRDKDGKLTTTSDTDWGTSKEWNYNTSSNNNSYKYGSKKVKEPTSAYGRFYESAENEEELNELLPPAPPAPPMPSLNASLENDEGLNELFDAQINLDARELGGKNNNVSVLGGKLPLKHDSEDERTNEGIFSKRTEKEVSAHDVKKGDIIVDDDGEKLKVKKVTKNDDGRTEIDHKHGNISAGKDSTATYKVLRKESLEESVNNVTVETDDSIVNVSTDEDGKVTVTTEPNTVADAESGDEVITPVSPETQAEIEMSSNEDPAEDEFVDMDVEEFDEESFDGLGESYLKRVYENVDSYKTTKVAEKGNKIVVEGAIKFKSGKIGKTSFMFEARDCTRSGKVRFVGENAQLAKGKKSFTITGSLNDKKFITESFNYNYRAENNLGKSSRICGTIKK